MSKLSSLPRSTLHTSRSVLMKKTELKYEKQYLYNETTEHPMRGSAERRSHER